jgi:hypothetical protein
MVQYDNYLVVQRPGLQKFKGTVISHPAEDKLGNPGTIKTTLPNVDVPSGDPDDVEQVMSTLGAVEVAESFKNADGRAVGKKKTVNGLRQAAALGHQGAAAVCAAKDAARAAEIKAEEEAKDAARAAEIKAEEEAKDAAA